MRVVICGAGIVGTALAYFLSERRVQVVLVERHRVAGAASGHSGGFLARDWCDGSALGPLARASFDLHAELARVLPCDVGYRRVDTLMVALGRRRASSGVENEAWLDGSCRIEGYLGTTETTAQVHPGELTGALLDVAQARGAELRFGRVEGIALCDGGSRVAGASVDGETLPADAVVITLGPWSGLASAWLATPPVFGLKGHSIRLRPHRSIPAQALFVAGAEGEGD
jgi:glycine/D-amino acid oxidase-like deaminating enzyme